MRPGAALRFSVAVAAGAATATGLGVKPTNRPNIVAIVADDHGYADMSRLGIHPNVRTPNLDRLAREGVMCEEFYATAPICSPSRCGLLTGQYQEKWGALWFGSSTLPDGVPTLPEKMKELGYETGFIGKVHYGTTDNPTGRGFPPNHGFEDSYFALCNGRIHYLHHSKAAMRLYGSAAQTMSVQPMWHNREEEDFEGFTTWEFGKRAREFIDRKRGKPFYLHLAFNAVHNFAWQLPQEELDKRGLPAHDDYMPGNENYLDWYDNVIMPNLEHGRDYYLAQLELMDQEIGRLLDHLDETGLAQNTIVVYMSDNGGSTCNYGDNTPLRGTKYTLYEGGIRVPLIVRWPAGGVPAGKTRRGIVSSMDLMPTLLAASGAKPSAYRQCDGRNVLSFLRGNGRAPHQRLFWDNGFQYAVRDGKWKLYCVPDAKAASYLQIEHAKPAVGTELYDLKADPGEKINLARANPEVVERLTKAFEDWKAKTAPVAAKKARG